MTLGEFFQALSDNPSVVCFLFISVPLTAFLASIFGKDEGAISPWKELYTILVYLTSVPGIFAVTLNVYLFLFERQSINDVNLYTQVMPIISMVLTLWLIRKNVKLDQVPGFEKLGGLIMILFVLIVGMLLIEKTHIFAITIIPFSYFVILFIVLLVVIRLGWKRMVQ